MLVGCNVANVYVYIYVYFTNWICCQCAVRFKGRLEGSRQQSVRQMFTLLHLIISILTSATLTGLLQLICQSAMALTTNQTCLIQLIYTYIYISLSVCSVIYIYYSLIVINLYYFNYCITWKWALMARELFLATRAAFLRQITRRSFNETCITALLLGNQ